MVRCRLGARLAGPEEWRLASWLLNCLSRARQRLLVHSKMKYLKQIPAIAEKLGVQKLSRPPRVAEWPSRVQGGKTAWDVPWPEQCALLKSWVLKHGGILPKPTSGDEEEKALAEWLTFADGQPSQRTLSEQQLGLLENALAEQQLRQIPEVVDRLDQEAEQGQVAGNVQDQLRVISEKLAAADDASEAATATWSDRLRSVQSWTEEHDGTLPAERALASQTEKSLAKWLSHNIHQARKGQLELDKVEQLQQIPAIAERLDHSDWSSRLRNIQSWLQENDGTLPGDRLLASQTEKGLAKWLTYIIYRARKGQLELDRVEQLQQIPAIAEKLALELRVS
ncbi:unnamed protein product [Polarella glacialis]|uniref:Uncharacterized protein n=1 Tax=Polarella glacialis TaxID=89957 RepID=A0A813LEX1_POLGL|nr:unnamed protein product [Polarella glacialis]